jgi:hypothetical protein
MCILDRRARIHAELKEIGQKSQGMKQSETYQVVSATGTALWLFVIDKARLYTVTNLMHDRLFRTASDLNADFASRKSLTILVSSL